MSKADEVVAAAKKFVDEKYKEGENNDTIMGKWFGLNHQPWCAMFVSYCFNQAKVVDLVAAQGKKGFASCAAGMRWFAKHKQLVPVGQAQAGDVVFFQFDADADPDHVGIVVSNDGKGTLITYEGNTCADGAKGSQANGDGAYKKKRPYAKVMAVARPAWKD